MNEPAEEFKFTPPPPEIGGVQTHVEVASPSEDQPLEAAAGEPVEEIDIPNLVDTIKSNPKLAERLQAIGELVKLAQSKNKQANKAASELRNLYLALEELTDELGVLVRRKVGAVLLDLDPTGDIIRTLHAQIAEVAKTRDTVADKIKRIASLRGIDLSVPYDPYPNEALGLKSEDIPDLVQTAGTADHIDFRTDAILDLCFMAKGIGSANSNSLESQAAKRALEEIFLDCELADEIGVHTRWLAREALMELGYDDERLVALVSDDEEQEVIQKFLQSTSEDVNFFNKDFHTLSNSEKALENIPIGSDYIEEIQPGGSAGWEEDIFAGTIDCELGVTSNEDSQEVDTAIYEGPETILSIQTCQNGEANADSIREEPVNTFAQHLSIYTLAQRRRVLRNVSDYPQMVLGYAEREDHNDVRLYKRGIVELCKLKKADVVTWVLGLTKDRCDEIRIIGIEQISELQNMAPESATSTRQEQCVTETAVNELLPLAQDHTLGAVSNAALCAILKLHPDSSSLEEVEDEIIAREEANFSREFKDTEAAIESNFKGFSVTYLKPLQHRPEARAVLATVVLSEDMAPADVQLKAFKLLASTSAGCTSLMEAAVAEKGGVDKLLRVLGDREDRVDKLLQALSEDSDAHRQRQILDVLVEREHALVRTAIWNFNPVDDSVFMSILKAVWNEHFEGVPVAVPREVRERHAREPAELKERPAEESGRTSASDKFMQLTDRIRTSQNPIGEILELYGIFYSDATTCNFLFDEFRVIVTNSPQPGRFLGLMHEFNAEHPGVTWLMLNLLQHETNVNIARLIITLLNERVKTMSGRQSAWFRSVKANWGM